jgi:hypothetical protein
MSLGCIGGTIAAACWATKSAADQARPSRRQPTPSWGAAPAKRSKTSAKPKARTIGYLPATRAARASAATPSGTARSRPPPPSPARISGVRLGRVDLGVHPHRKDRPIGACCAADGHASQKNLHGVGQGGQRLRIQPVGATHWWNR